MATKNLARTVVEGGRRGRWRERYHTRVERQTSRIELRQIAAGSADDPQAQRRRGLGSFSDKLKPVERWLAAQAGRPWSKVYSELCQKYDRRTLKGWHLLSGHVDRYMVKGHGADLWPSYDEPSSYGLWIDQHGILRFRQRRRWGR